MTYKTRKFIGVMLIVIGTILTGCTREVIIEEPHKASDVVRIETREIENKEIETIEIETKEIETILIQDYKLK